MADERPVSALTSAFMQFESDLAQRIQALESAALGRDPEALLAIAHALETTLEAMDQTDLSRLNAEHPQDQPQVVQALERLQTHMRKAFAVVAQRRDQAGATLQALGAEPAPIGYGETATGHYGGGRMLGQA